MLLTTVALPLAASPVVSGLLAYLLHRASAEPLARASRYCVCVENHAPASVRLPQAVSSITLVDAPPITLGPEVTCDDAATTHRIASTPPRRPAPMMAPVAAEDDGNLMNMKARWFVRGMLVGIALTLALNFVLTQ